MGVDGLQVLFAELGTLDGGDTGAHDQQHAVCNAAEDRSVGDNADRRGVDDDIIKCLLQGSENLLGHRGGEQLGGVRRDRTGGQDRDAGILDADKRRGQCAFILGGDDVRQTGMVARNAQIAGDRRLTQVTVYQNNTIAGGGQCHGQVEGYVALTLLRDRGGNQDGLAVAGRGKKFQVGTQGFVGFHKLERGVAADGIQFAMAGVFACLAHFFLPP